MSETTLTVDILDERVEAEFLGWSGEFAIVYHNGSEKFIDPARIHGKCECGNLFKLCHPDA